MCLLHSAGRDFEKTLGNYMRDVLTATITGASPRGPDHETESVSSRKNAAKRNVANRLLHAMLGRF